MLSVNDSVWAAWLAPCSTTTPSSPAASQPTADCLGTAAFSSYGSRKSYISFSLLFLWSPELPAPAQTATNPAPHCYRNRAYEFKEFPPPLRRNNSYGDNQTRNWTWLRPLGPTAKEFPREHSVKRCARRR